jgi:hypothetical protein
MVGMAGAADEVAVRYIGTVSGAFMAAAVSCAFRAVASNACSAEEVGI